MRILLFYFSVFTIALSCSTTEKKGEPLPDKNVNYPFDYVEHVSAQFLYPLKTSSISNNEIRLWLNYEVFDVADLIILKDIGSLTYLTKYHYHKKDISRMYLIDSVSVTNEIVTTTAKELSTDLFSKKFKKLVNQPDSIRKSMGDGITYIIELRDSAYYKLLHYNSPYHFNDDNHQSFMKIIRALEPALKWKHEKW